MKSKLLLLSFLMLLSVATNYAQGIAVQGIARDANNTAKISAPINFKFTIYYNKAGTVYTPVAITQNLTTDAFGVFSYVIPATALDNTTLLENELYLKIEQLTAPAAVISDEKLNHVPYAMSASNGVPTGSIMPYLGTTAPAGWVLCDGNVLPATAKALIDMVGNNAPNLRGMFLRGAGENANAGMSANDGPALKAMQGDEFKSHQHSSGSLVNSTNGAHNHRGTDPLLNKLVKYTGVNTAVNVDNNTGQFDLINAGEIPDDGNHTHTISGSTAPIGGNETRPVNYGVNYIIKL